MRLKWTGISKEKSAQKLRADPGDQPPIEERSIMMQIGAGSIPYARICPSYPFKHALIMNSGENELLPNSPPPESRFSRVCPKQNIRHIFTNAKFKSVFFSKKILFAFSGFFLNGTPITPVKIPLKTLIN